MRSGATSRSRTTGLESFQIELEDGFLQNATSRKADPEAVATFVQQKVLKKAEVLTAQDAELRETWPAIRDAYGLPARVFYSLARFLEAGMRSGNKALISVFPVWSFHESFGPELCRFQGGIPETYLLTLGRLISDGHASGEPNAWVRPRFDFLLQAERLDGVDMEIPSAEWFAERAARLDPLHRFALAARLASSGAPEQLLPHDEIWQLGCALGILFLASTEQDFGLKTNLINQALQAARRITNDEPKLAAAWTSLGLGFGMHEESESDDERRSELRDYAIRAFRRAVAGDSKNVDAWYNLGVGLGRAADADSNRLQRAELAQEAGVAPVSWTRIPFERIGVVERSP